jgi:hypothetical protein
MFKRAAVIFFLASAMGATAQPAHAQQTLNFTLGYFTVHGEDARTTGDILTSDRRFLTFDLGDFNGATVGGEWLVPFGNYFEGGAGISFTRRTVPSVYTCCTASNGDEVVQRLRLRTVPISFTVRAVPTGQHSAVQPYIGGGIAVINWRYSESGDFIDFANNNEIFRDTFVGNGTATGPVALGGIRFAGDHASAGFEVRYQAAKDDLPASEFASGPNPNPRIDLGGWTYQFTGGFRFGR